MEHKDITDPNIHEAKGASTASLGEVLTANGDGTATFQLPTVGASMGWYDYNDLATQSAPIALTTAGTYYDLTNDGAGPNTSVVYGLADVPDIWNIATNRLDLTLLDIGDTLEIRVDVTATTGGANTGLDLVLELATGSGTPVSIPLINNTNIKTASTVQIIGDRGFYVGSTLVKNNPAKIKMRADTTGTTVKVNGFYIRVIKRG